MKKTKTDERTENAFDSFFTDENLNKDSFLAVTGNQGLSVSSLEFTQPADKYFSYFKKIFAYLPGILFLHLAVPSAIYFGFGLWTLFWLAAGIFMVWAGVGDLKNKKHFLLPLSAVLMAAIFALPFGVLPVNALNYYIYLYIGILPLIFTAPVLTKGLIEKNERSES